jgi:uncharacterized membrane protein YgcG
MKTTEEKDRVRAEFYSSIDKSENDLERKITYISAGALALSITFMEKIVDLTSAEHFYLLIIGWILLALTLAVNLISTLTSRKLTMKSLKDFDNEIEESELIKNIAKRNNLISNLDLASLISLLIGIFFVVIFCSVNLENRKINNDMSDKDKIEKGRVIQTPRPSTNTGGNGNSGNNSGNSGGNGSSGGNSNSDKK